MPHSKDTTGHCCEGCGAPLFNPRSRFCSNACHAQWRWRGHLEDATCEVCGSIFRPRTKTRIARFCSIPCKSESQRRSNWDVTPADIERFWSKVNVGADDDCWLWTAAMRRHGYGEIQWRGKVEAATRVSWEIAFGSWPTDGVLHRCDNPACVNPRHLFVGDQSVNMTDCAKKNRTARGSRNGQAILSESDVLAIVRRSGESNAALAREFGVSEATISTVLSGKRWGHVTHIERSQRQTS